MYTARLLQGRRCTLRRQCIIKDDLAVSHDVQTGAVAHEDRVRTRGVRIPAEHDLLTSAGIEVMERVL